MAFCFTHVYREWQEGYTKCCSSHAVISQWFISATQPHKPMQITVRLWKKYCMVHPADICGERNTMQSESKQHINECGVPWNQLTRDHLATETGGQLGRSIKDHPQLGDGAGVFPDSMHRKIIDAVWKFVHGRQRHFYCMTHVKVLLDSSRKLDEVSFVIYAMFKCKKPSNSCWSTLTKCSSIRLQW